MSAIKDKPILELSSFSGVVVNILVIAPFIVIIGAVLFASAENFEDYLKATFYFIITFFCVFWVFAYDKYVKISVFTTKISFVYPFRFYKRRISFKYDEIEKIDLSPPPVPRSSSSFEIFLINKQKSIHLFHQLSTTQIKKLKNVLLTLINLL